MEASNTQNNEMEIRFDSRSENEGFARVSVASFLTQLNPTVEEVADVKTAVSEAVTNAIIHGYDNQVRKIRIRCQVSERTLYVQVEDDGKGIADEKVKIHCSIENQLFTVEISDRGKGIANVEKAMEPMFTTKPEDDRSGMGFSFMEAFMDTVEVESKVGEGTSVKMTKTIGKGSRIWTTQSL